MIPPTAFEWTGESMLPKHPRLADQRFVIGQTYALVPHEDRSQASHNHEFGFVGEAWKTLPEWLADECPSPNHLRKHALIETGWYDETTVDAGSQAAALRVAAFMRADNDLAKIVTRGSIVVKRVAKSQSRRAMNKQDFQASKTAILEWISEQIGVAPEELLLARAA